MAPTGLDAATRRLRPGQKVEIKKDENLFNFSILDIPSQDSQWAGSNFTYTENIEDQGFIAGRERSSVYIDGYITRGFNGSFTITSGDEPPTTTSTTTTTTTPPPCPTGKERLRPGGPCVPKCPEGWRRDAEGNCYDPDPVDPNSSEDSGQGSGGFDSGLVWVTPDNGLTHLDFTYTEDTTTSTTTTSTTPYYTTSTTTSTTTYTTPYYTTPPPPCTITTKPPDTGGGGGHPRTTTQGPSTRVTRPPVVRTTVPPQIRIPIYPAPILPLQVPFLMEVVQTATTTLPPYTTPPPVVATTIPVTTICPEDPDCNILQY